MQQNFLRLPYCLFLFLLFQISCSSDINSNTKEPDIIIPQAKMVEILTDMQEAEGVMAIKMLGDLNKSTKQKNIYQSAILNKYQVSQKDFWDNYQYYADNPKQLDTIYAQVIKALEKQMPIEKERMAKNPPPPTTPPATPIPVTPKILPPISSTKGGKSQ